MTLPHRYIPNQVVKISRGTLNRMPLIIPDEKGELCQYINFIFARAAFIFKIQILALHVEPFGYEAIIIDPRMQRSEFLQMVNQAISLEVKSRITHYESLWSNQKPGNLPILDIETLKSELFKLCIAPVRNGYVRKSSDWKLPLIEPKDWGTEQTYYVCPEQKDMGKAIMCPGQNKFQLAASDKVTMHTKIEDLKPLLISEIRAFEVEERRRRKKVLGVKKCHQKSAFLEHKSKTGATYTDHKVVVLCASAKRREEIREFLKCYYKKYRDALLLFIRERPKPGNEGFPYGSVRMCSLFRVGCRDREGEELFQFLF